MPVLIPTLDNASVGAPLTRAGISLIPVYLHGDNPPAVSADTGTLTVTEAPNANVPTLVITSTAGLPTLIAEGEVLRGGQQDRVVNTSVLGLESSSATTCGNIFKPMCPAQGKRSMAGGRRVSTRRSLPFSPCTLTPLSCGINTCCAWS